jgi:hypothetical protein
MERDTICFMESGCTDISNVDGVLECTDMVHSCRQDVDIQKEEQREFDTHDEFERQEQQNLEVRTARVPVRVIDESGALVKIMLEDGSDKTEWITVGELQQDDGGQFIDDPPSVPAPQGQANDFGDLLSGAVSTNSGTAQIIGIHSGEQQEDAVAEMEIKWHLENDLPSFAPTADSGDDSDGDADSFYFGGDATGSGSGAGSGAAPLDPPNQSRAPSPTEPWGEKTPAALPYDLAIALFVAVCLCGLYSLVTARRKKANSIPKTNYPRYAGESTAVTPGASSEATQPPRGVQISEGGKDLEHTDTRHRNNTPTATSTEVDTHTFDDKFFRFCGCCVPICFNGLLHDEIFRDRIKAELREPKLELHLDGKVIVNHLPHDRPSYWSDLFFFIFQKDHFLSIFYCHHEHPFTKRERQKVYFAMAATATLLASAFLPPENCVGYVEPSAEDYEMQHSKGRKDIGWSKICNSGMSPQDAQMMAIGVVAVVKVVYGSVLEYVAFCPCFVDYVGAFKDRTEIIGALVLNAATLLGFFEFYIGIVVISNSPYKKDMVMAIVNALITGIVTGWLSQWVTYHITRSRESSCGEAFTSCKHGVDDADGDGIECMEVLRTMRKSWHDQKNTHTELNPDTKDDEEHTHDVAHLPDALNTPVVQRARTEYSPSAVRGAIDPSVGRG